jgi:NAD(P)-dependent dehydrogenase (short-subunit alcohol dehydrogenase family)
VTVNTVSPGIIMVDGLIRMGREKFGDDTLTGEDIAERLVAAQVFEMPPAGRLGIPRDIALVTCMLASPLSGFVTGANYRVDGGQIRSVN